MITRRLPFCAAVVALSIQPASAQAVTPPVVETGWRVRVAGVPGEGTVEGKVKGVEGRQLLLKADGREEPVRIELDRVTGVEHRVRVHKGRNMLIGAVLGMIPGLIIVGIEATNGDCEDGDSLCGIGYPMGGALAVIGAGVGVPIGYLASTSTWQPVSLRPGPPATSAAGQPRSQGRRIAVNYTLRF